MRRLLYLLIFALGFSGCGGQRDKGLHQDKDKPTPAREAKTEKGK